MTQKVEDIAEDFGIQMKKGFIRALILLILGDGPSYGAKIIKEIEKHTLNVWSPKAAAIYPLLSSLKDEELIEEVKLKATKKNKKQYKITKKGEKILKLLIEKFEKIVRAMRLILTSIKGHDSNYAFEDIINILPDDPLFGWTNGKTLEEKIDNINYDKHVVEERILYYKDLKKYLNSEIERLENTNLKKKR